MSVTQEKGIEVLTSLLQSKIQSRDVSALVDLLQKLEVLLLKHETDEAADSSEEEEEEEEEEDASHPEYIISDVQVWVDLSAILIDVLGLSHTLSKDQSLSSDEGNQQRLKTCILLTFRALVSIVKKCSFGTKWDAIGNVATGFLDHPDDEVFDEAIECLRVYSATRDYPQQTHEQANHRTDVLLADALYTYFDEGKTVRTHALLKLMSVLVPYTKIRRMVVPDGAFVRPALGKLLCSYLEKGEEHDEALDNALFVLAQMSFSKPSILHDDRIFTSQILAMLAKRAMEPERSTRSVSLSFELLGNFVYMDSLYAQRAFDAGVVRVVEHVLLHRCQMDNADSRALRTSAVRTFRKIMGCDQDQVVFALEQGRQIFEWLTQAARTMTFTDAYLLTWVDLAGALGNLLTGYESRRFLPEMMKWFPMTQLLLTMHTHPLKSVHNGLLDCMECFMDQVGLKAALNEIASIPDAVLQSRIRQRNALERMLRDSKASGSYPYIAWAMLLMRIGCRATDPLTNPSSGNVLRLAKMVQPAIYVRLVEAEVLLLLVKLRYSPQAPSSPRRPWLTSDLWAYLRPFYVEAVSAQEPLRIAEEHLVSAQLKLPSLRDM